MATETEICILALRRLGQEANLTSLDENSAYVESTKATYPIVRDALLERHAWNFATTKVRPARLMEKPIGWDAMYAVPDDCIRVLSVTSEDDYDADRMYRAGRYGTYAEGYAYGTWHADDEWAVEMFGRYRTIQTNIRRPIVKYIRKVREPGYFSPAFADALAWNVAAAMAGPIVKGETGLTVANRLLQFAQYYEGVAIRSDISQRHAHHTRPMAPWDGL